MSLCPLSGSRRTSLNRLPDVLQSPRSRERDRRRKLRRGHLQRRAKIIHAEGEFQAVQKLAEAAEVISQNPAVLQLRYLQTLVEIAGEKDSTTISPNPGRYPCTFYKGLFSK